MDQTRPRQGRGNQKGDVLAEEQKTGVSAFSKARKILYSLKSRIRHGPICVMVPYASCKKIIKKKYSIETLTKEARNGRKAGRSMCS